MADTLCLPTSVKEKKKNAMATCGLDLRCRKAYWMAVEQRTDLPQPAKPLSQRNEPGISSHHLYAGPWTNHRPVPGCFFLQASLKSIVASGAFNHSKTLLSTWLALTRSIKVLISSTSFRMLLVSFSCSCCDAEDMRLKTSATSYSSLLNVFSRNG